MLLDLLLFVVYGGVAALVIYAAFGGWGLVAALALIAAALPWHARWSRQQARRRTS